MLVPDWIGAMVVLEVLFGPGVVVTVALFPSIGVVVAEIVACCPEVVELVFSGVAKGTVVEIELN